MYQVEQSDNVASTFNAVKDNVQVFLFAIASA